MTVESSLTSPDIGNKEAIKSRNTFSKKDVVGIHPHDNDPVVITIGYGEWEIKRVLIDHENFVGILYWNAFERFVWN